MKSKTERPFGGQIRKRPLDPLLGEESATGNQSLTLEQIQLPSSQPRRYFDEKALSELVSSVKQHGILQPLLVRPLNEGKYELVAGERRYRAALEVGLSEVPVIIRELDNNEALQLSLIENLQREDLNPVEETEGILQLLSLRLSHPVSEIVSLLYRLNNEQTGKVNHNVVVNEEMTQIQEIFESLGRMQWQSFVKHRLPLLKLPHEIFEALQTGKIAYTKALSIAKVKDESDRKALLDEAITLDLSLSQIKEKIQLLNAQSQSKFEEEQQLSNRLTQLTRKLKKARIGTDPQKRQQLEDLIGQIEALLESEQEGNN
ncbi:MAG: ParB/RepB/Spo0J family partition protein [Hydrococcus sp. Prado102]|jgi:ParB family chromosome partitioning protein|nr:ParB/RepB/Spo0J family partition protein [Hydrococcus sp. Prado102]